MAGVKEYWLDEHKNYRVDLSIPYTYTCCIFQQQWYEYCKTVRRTGWRMQPLHVDFLSRLLLDSLLNHDLTAATRCVIALCGAMRKVPELIWRTGCEVLMSSHKHHARMIQFFKFVFMLCYPYQEEILIDFALYLVQYHRDLTEAYQLFNGKSTKKPLGRNKLLQGYMGLFEYTLWKLKAMKHRRRTIDIEEEESEMMLKQNDNLYHANKALQLFENLVECEGVWDIFLLRQIELLMFLEKFDNAQKILEQYREKNPDNPNAHRYLYYFYKKQGSPPSTLLPVLERLFSIDPTSELVKEYYHLVMDSINLKEHSNGICTLLEILFNKLDYHSSKDSVQDWKSLADILDMCYHDNVHDKDIDAKVKECWDERSEWWPGYHFNASIVMTPLSNHDYDVVFEKARVAKILLTEDSEFVKRVNKLERTNEESSTPRKDLALRKRTCLNDDSEDLDEVLRKKSKRKDKSKVYGSPSKRKKGQNY